MKTLKLLSAGLFLTSMLACAQKNNVSKKITTSFSTRFPNAKAIKWDKESDTEWEAEFKMNKMEYSANFDTNGDWKETEHEIEEKDIPTAVKNTLTNQFAGFKIEESEISETVSGSIYEFAIEKGKTEMEVAIDENGTIVKKETKKRE